MAIVNAVATAIAGACFAPFASLPPWLTLTVWSAIAGVLMMIIFRYTSNQKALKEVGNRVRANLLAMRLFKDELSVTFSCQWGLLKAIGARLWYSLAPLVVMIVPFVLGLAQLGAYYEKRPLRPDESAVVSLYLAEPAWDSNTDVRLQAPDGVVVETPGLRDRSERVIRWRVRARQAGQHKLVWEVSGQRVEKLLSAGAGLVPVSPKRPGTSFWDRLLYPVEPPLGEHDAVRAIEVVHPTRQTPILGWGIHWLITFFVLSIVFALLFKPVLKVQL